VRKIIEQPAPCATRPSRRSVKRTRSLPARAAEALAVARAEPYGAATRRPFCAVLEQPAAQPAEVRALQRGTRRARADHTADPQRGA